MACMSPGRFIPRPDSKQSIFSVPPVLVSSIVVTADLEQEIESQFLALRASITASITAAHDQVSGVITKHLSHFEHGRAGEEIGDRCCNGHATLDVRTLGAPPPDDLPGTPRARATSGTSVMRSTTPHSALRFLDGHSNEHQAAPHSPRQVCSGSSIVVEEHWCQGRQQRPVAHSEDPRCAARSRSPSGPAIPTALSRAISEGSEAAARRTVRITANAAAATGHARARADGSADGVGHASTGPAHAAAPGGGEDEARQASACSRDAGVGARPFSAGSDGADSEVGRICSNLGGAPPVRGREKLCLHGVEYDADADDLSHISTDQPSPRAACWSHVGKPGEGNPDGRVGIGGANDECASQESSSEASVLQASRSISCSKSFKSSKTMQLSGAVLSSALEYMTRTVEEEFKRISCEIAGARPHRLVSEEYAFLYKSRSCRGKAIHIAALHQTGAPVIARLIRLRASVDEEYTFDSFGSRGRAQPIHLAAGAGNVKAVRQLLYFRADANIKSLHGDELHLAPLHDAAYFDQAAAVRYLVKHAACVNTQNRSDMTPLHVAVKIGSPAVVEALIAAAANITQLDDVGRTPLMLAVEAGVFPKGNMHMLARYCVRDMQIIAKVHPDAAVDFLERYKVKSVENTLHMKQWHLDPTVLQQGSRPRIYEEFTVENFVHFMAIAPTVAETLLEVLVDEPNQTSAYHHPLYTHARLPGSAQMLCHYSVDGEWTCDVENTGGYPKWHDQLAPGGDDSAWQMIRCKRAGSMEALPKKSFTQVLSTATAPVVMTHQKMFKPEFVPVQIRLLRMKGIVCPTVLHSLSHTKHKPIFAKQAPQAILEYSWIHLVRQGYTINIVHRVIELLVLVAWTVATDHSEILWRYCWSVVMVITSKDVIAMYCNLYGYIVTLRAPRSYFGHVWHYADFLATGLSISFVWCTMNTVQSFPRLMSCTVFVRWLKLMYSFRAYQVADVGTKILPIIDSFFRMSGMLVIAVFTFCAFLHAFLAAYDRPITEAAGMFLITFKLLFLNEGDGGVNPLLRIGSDSDHGSWFTWLCAIVSVFVYCICILNILIAVLSEAYRAAYAEGMLSFMQARAQICLECMLMPRWRGRHLRRPLPCCAIIMSLALPTWFALLYDLRVHPLCPSALLSCAVFACDLLLVQRPWQGDTEDHFLWWCARAA